jgi:hypothetical protein
MLPDPVSRVAPGPATGMDLRAGHSLPRLCQSATGLEPRSEAAQQLAAVPDNNLPIDRERDCRAVRPKGFSLQFTDFPGDPD